MAKLCINCGKKNNLFFGDGIQLSDNKFLCSKCDGPISDDLHNLWYAKTLEEFDAKKEEILKVSHKIFSDEIVNEINTVIENVYRPSAEYQQKSSSHNYNNYTSEMRKVIDNHMITTGFNFEGYSIKKYITVISAEVVLGTGFLSEFTASFSDFFGTESNAFSNKIQEAKQAALSKLINKSIDLGGNAIIGIDFDHIMFRNNMIGVIVNGTCVQVKKIEN